MKGVSWSLTHQIVNVNKVGHWLIDGIRLDCNVLHETIFLHIFKLSTYYIMWSSWIAFNQKRWYLQIKGDDSNFESWCTSHIIQGCIRFSKHFASTSMYSAAYALLLYEKKWRRESHWRCLRLFFWILRLYSSCDDYTYFKWISQRSRRCWNCFGWFGCDKLIFFTLSNILTPLSSWSCTQ